jgi:hypothetical protein
LLLWREVLRRIPLAGVEVQERAEIPELETAAGMMLELADRVWSDAPPPNRGEAGAPPIKSH